MLKATFCRPLPCFPVLTRSCARNLQRIHITSRSSFRLFTTTSVLCDTKRVDGTTTGSGANEYRPSDAPNLRKASPFDWETLRTRFRELSDRSLVAMRQRADDFTAKTWLPAFSLVGSHLNRVTGYEEIEALKRRVIDQEVRLATTRQVAREAKKDYDQAVIQRSNSQREVNDLLQRKSNWTDGDVSRFTTLVRQDHLYEQEEVRAKATVAAADDAVDREFSQLMRTILARYHEEQVWSDKIRSASTYGSLAALGLNMIIFILAIIIVEPWKRRRLAQTFERKIEEISAENTAMVKGGMKDLARHFVEQEKMLSEMIEASSKSPESHLLESTKELPSMVERIVRAAKDQEIAAVFAVSTATAAVIGWMARSWLGF